MPPTPPDLNKVWAELQKDQAKLQAVPRVLPGINQEKYEHWDTIRFGKVPKPLDPEDVWAITKFFRVAGSRSLPLDDKNGRSLTYFQTNAFLRSLHEIDSNACGAIGVPGAAANPAGRDLYLQRSLIEEPFSSSVLEGAAATRAQAKRLIEEGKAPRTLGERMIINNYRAMEFIREHRSEPLTVARVLEVHRILTIDTLDRPEKCGVFRAPDDVVVVEDTATGETLHIPPKAEELPTRVQKLCDFANGDAEQGGVFMHPVIRAIILHYMLAYDHPFWDGNGRCARALFYWSVLRQGYWLLEYISISAVIRKAPIKYGTAILYSETDAGDVTYFIDHQLGVIQSAIADLHKYLDAKATELRTLGQALGNLERILNERQLKIIQDALKRSHAQYTIRTHAITQGVHYLTARQDLEQLSNMGLLLRRKEGVQLLFTVPGNLQDRLNKRAA